MDTRVETALITSGIGVAIGVVWKIINHYRLKSECNKDNQLVVSVVNTTTEKPISPDDLKCVALEIKDAITTNNNN